MIMTKYNDALGAIDNVLAFVGASVFPVFQSQIPEVVEMGYYADICTSLSW